MTTLLILLFALVIVDIAIVAGWGHDSRESRDGRFEQPRRVERDDGDWYDAPAARDTWPADRLAPWTSSSGPRWRPNSTRSAH
jgi:hypothetical protein